MSIKPSDYGENWTKWDETMTYHCEQQSVPWRWMKCIALIESSLGLDPHVACGIQNPDDIQSSVSEDKKSWGLLQMQPTTAKDFDPDATPLKLNDPEYTIEIGAKLLAWLYKGLEGSEEFVIKAWNEGLGAATKEKAGKIPGKAGEYWNKYLKYKAILDE